MPRTRRAGRKNQLRRQTKAHLRELANRSVESDITDNFSTPVREQLNEKGSFVYKLIPITVEQSPLPHSEIPENDPRCEYIKTQIESVSASSE